MDVTVCVSSLLLGLLCYSCPTQSSRIACPAHYPCRCRPVRIYPEIAVIENRIDCTRKQLDDIPTMDLFIGYKISAILLAGNSIHHIPNGTFYNITLGNEHARSGKLSDSPIIDLSGNHLQRLSGHELDGLVALDLVTVDMSECAFVSFPVLPLGVVTHVSKLYLQQNYISFVTKEMFVNYTSLMVLDLSENQALRMADDSLMAVRGSLRALYLTSTGMEEFPVSLIRDIPNLIQLDLSANRITNLSDHLMETMICDRIVIRLNDNQISHISDKAFLAKGAMVTGDADGDVETARGPGGGCVIRYLSLENNNITSLGWLQQPCRMTLSKVSVFANRVHCDCMLHELLSHKVLTVLGVCGSPPGLAGADLEWPQGESTRWGAEGAFLWQTAPYCGYDRDQIRYDCLCDGWVPLDMTCSAAPPSGLRTEVALTLVTAPGVALTLTWALCAGAATHRSP